MWKNQPHKCILKAQSEKETETMIGTVISEKRKELGLTQAQLGERLGVTAPAVNRWEKNLSFPDANLLAPPCSLPPYGFERTVFLLYRIIEDGDKENWKKIYLPADL